MLQDTMSKSFHQMKYWGIFIRNRDDSGLWDTTQQDDQDITPAVMTHLYFPLSVKLKFLLDSCDSLWFIPICKYHSINLMCLVIRPKVLLLSSEPDEHFYLPVVCIRIRFQFLLSLPFFKDRLVLSHRDHHVSYTSSAVWREDFQGFCLASAFY